MSDLQVICNVTPILIVLLYRKQGFPGVDISVESSSLIHIRDLFVSDDVSLMG